MGIDTLDKVDRNGFAYNWVISTHPDSAKVSISNKTPDTFTAVKESAAKLGFTVKRKGNIGERVEIITPIYSYTYYFSTGKWAYTPECNKKHQQVACAASFFHMIKKEALVEKPLPTLVKLYGVTAVHELSFRSEVVSHEFNATSMSDAAKQAEAEGFEPIVIWRVGK
jgi:hypothetical protein